jgi:hypothetical protein
MAPKQQETTCNKMAPKSKDDNSNIARWRQLAVVFFIQVQGVVRRLGSIPSKTQYLRLLKQTGKEHNL